MSQALLLLSSVLLTFALVVPSSAQKVTEEKTFGDWRLYEDMDYDGPVPPKPKGIADTAATNALNDRKANLAFTCSTYSVMYFLYGDKEFNDAVLRENQNDLTFQVAYTKNNKDDYFRKEITQNGYVRSFYTSPESLMRSGTFMICPTQNDKDPACLAFSLRGFTAALKALCPKR